MRVGLRLVGALVLQADLTIAAIAAGSALLAKMIGARILGAFHANTGGLFFADTADKWHGGSHKGVVVIGYGGSFSTDPQQAAARELPGSAGLRDPRQRTADLSHWPIRERTAQDGQAATDLRLQPIR